MGTEQRRLSLASVTATPCALKLRAGESTIPRRVIDWRKHLKQRPAQNSVRRPTISLGDKSRSRCPPQSRAQRSQPRDEFALDRGLRIVVSDYRNLECAEVFARSSRPSITLSAVNHRAGRCASPAACPHRFSAWCFGECSPDWLRFVEMCSSAARCRRRACVIRADVIKPRFCNSIGAFDNAHGKKRLDSSPARGVEPGSCPQLTSHFDRIDLVGLPPRGFVTASVQRAMVTPAQRDGVLVAHSTADSPWLSEAEMMGVRRPSAADQAWLRRYEPEVCAVAVAARFTERQCPLVNMPSHRIVDSRWQLDLARLAFCRRR
jgi:hypothetical protein